MDPLNCLLNNFSVCSETRRKVQNLRNNRSRRIFGVFKNLLSKANLNFYKEIEKSFDK